MKKSNKEERVIYDGNTIEVNMDMKDWIDELEQKKQKILKNLDRKENLKKLESKIFSAIGQKSGLTDVIKNDIRSLFSEIEKRDQVISRLKPLIGNTSWGDTSHLEKEIEDLLK